MQVAGDSIHNLRYLDDTVMIAEHVADVPLLDIVVIRNAKRTFLDAGRGGGSIFYLVIKSEIMNSIK